MGTIQDEDKRLIHESEDDLPSPEDCITHLKLMAAFSYLKEDVIKSKDLFLAETDLTEQSEGDRQSTLEEKRWTIYVSRAVRRFERWATSLIAREKEKTSNGSRTQGNCSRSTAEELQDQSEASTLTADDLPPLDVLLVFHAFMLNPRWFLDDCLRLKWMFLWTVGMPWNLLARFIDTETLEYNVPESTKTSFIQTGLHWNNLDDTDSQLLRCSICSTLHGREQQPATNEWLHDPEFSLLCALPCRNRNHLWQLQAENLQRDLQSFNEKQVPLRATFLDHRGRTPENQVDKRPPRNFAARLLSEKAIRAQLESKERSKSTTAVNIVATVFDQADSSARSSNFTVRKIKSDRLSSQISFAEQYSLSRTRIAYTEHNGLPFSIDLTAAVLRQGKFVHDMRDIAWIFSPNLRRTVENLLGNYEAFLEVMAGSARDEISVPTLAVDLAWHTHQLSPPRYFRYCVAEVNGLFVDHDDRVGEGDLEVAFKRTSERFKEVTSGGNYGECMCWHCAALDLHARELSQENGEARRTHIEHRAAETMREFQRRKFDHDYKRHQRRTGSVSQATDIVTSPERILFAQNYKWLYPDYVPNNKA